MAVDSSLFVDEVFEHVHGVSLRLTQERGAARYGENTTDDVGFLGLIDGRLLLARTKKQDNAKNENNTE
jgi:hypothetical protein